MHEAILTALILLAPPPDRWDQAKHHFERGEWRQAAELLDQFVVDGPDDGVVLLNLGHARLLAGQLPQAILAYRRSEQTEAAELARMILPRVRAEAGLPAPSGRRLMDRDPLTQLLPLSFGYLAGWALLLFSQGNNVRRLGRSLIFGCAGLLGWFAHEDWQAQRHPLAVVLSDDLEPRIGNGWSYPPLQTETGPARLRRGLEMDALEQRANGWVRVRIPNGNCGWVPKQGVLMDRDPPQA